AAMKPRTHHQHVVDSGILLLNRLICPERTEKIFIVIPTADGHYRRMNVLQVRKDVSLFPKLIVIRVLDHLVPELDARAELLLIHVAGVLHAAHVEIILVTILRSVIEGLHVVVVRSWHGSWLAKAGRTKSSARETARRCDDCRRRETNP